MCLQSGNRHVLYEYIADILTDYLYTRTDRHVTQLLYICHILIRQIDRASCYVCSSNEVNTW